MVRVPWLDPQIIMKTMDAGAMGVICPMINNLKQAEGGILYEISTSGQRSLVQLGHVFFWKCLLGRC